MVSGMPASPQLFPRQPGPVVWRRTRIGTCSAEAGCPNLPWAPCLCCAGVRRPQPLGLLPFGVTLCAPTCCPPPPQECPSRGALWSLAFRRGWLEPPKAFVSYARVYCLRLADKGEPGLLVQGPAVPERRSPKHPVLFLCSAHWAAPLSHSWASTPSHLLSGCFANARAVISNPHAPKGWVRSSCSLATARNLLGIRPDTQLCLWVNLCLPWETG